jgi:hypothetical protein
MTCSCWTWALALAGALRHCTPLHNPVTRASEACDLRASVAEEGGAAGNSDKLKRALKLWDVVAITIGTIIGSGIFASANRVLKQAGSVGHMLLVWVCRWLRLVIDAQQSLMRAILFAAVSSSPWGLSCVVLAFCKSSPQNFAHHVF